MLSVLTNLQNRLRTLFTHLAQDRRLRLECSVLGGLVLAILLTAGCSSFARVAKQVRADTLRLHVQARSDSPADQLLKLQVRDAVLQDAAGLFGGCPDQSRACLLAWSALPRLQQTAEHRAAQLGRACPARVYLTRMSFDTTHYRQFSLPAGTYDALRVQLGRAEGHNWFCVLYPGLCLPAAEDKAPAAYPTRSEQKLVTERFKVRFALLEFWQTLRQLLRF